MKLALESYNRKLDQYFIPPKFNHWRQLTHSERFKDICHVASWVLGGGVIGGFAWLLGRGIVCCRSLHGRVKQWMHHRNQNQINPLPLPQPNVNDINHEPVVQPIPLRLAVGLPNLGNSCWLNSALKFLALADVYTPFLQLDINPLDEARNISDSEFPLLKRLHQKLNEVIAVLKNGATENILNISLYKELLDAIAKVNIFNDLNIDPWKEQLDAQEFIRLLMSKFNYPTNDSLNNTSDFSKLINAYRVSPEKTAAGSLKNAVITPGLLEVELCDPLDNKETAILFNEGLKASSEVEVSIDFSPDPLLIGTNTTFIKENFLSNAPDSLIVNSARKQPIVTEAGEIETIRSKRPIQFDLDQTVKIPIYEISDNSLKIKEFAVYCIQSALFKSGDKDAGHWVCYERTAKGDFLCHNDGSIYPVSKSDAADAFAMATLLHLRKT